MKTCNKCEYVNTEDAAFCEECGNSLTEVETNFKEKNCFVCGSKNEIDAKFCQDCGATLEEKEALDSQNASTKAPTCDNCGVERLNNASFCEECGQPFEKNKVTNQNLKVEQDIPNQQQTPLPKLPTKPKPKKKMKLAHKILIAILVVSIISTIGAYKFFDNKYSKDNQIKEFITAINRNDSSFLAKHMMSDDPSLKISKEIVTPMLAYFEENKDAVNKLNKEFDNNHAYLGLSIKEDGKKAFLFPEYKINVEPVYAVVTSNSKNSKIEMNDKELFTTDSNEFERKIGPYVPGVYRFKASIKDQKEVVENSYELFPDSVQVVTSKENEDDEYTDSESNNIIDMAFKKVKLPISSNMKDSLVFINDKEVGKVDKDQTTIGPLLWTEDLSIHLVKKTDNGEIKTETKKVTSNDLGYEENGVYTAPSMYFEFNVADNRDLERGLALFYDDFSKVVVASSDYNSAEFASRYYENGDKNEAFSGINDYIKWCRERSAKKEYEGVNFNINVASVDPVSDDTYKIKYNVEYRTSYPYATKKSMRIEGFDYSNVTVKLKMDEDNYSVKSFQFVDMGDGGKKVKDNGANE